MKQAIVFIFLVFGFTGMAHASGVSNGYEDGVYRGAYINPQELTIQFSLKDGKFDTIRFRSLSYKNEDYLRTDDPAKSGVRAQFEDLAAHLIGKDVTVVRELYAPGNIAQDVDGVSGATLRSGKMISAINDALGRGAYSLP